MNKLPDQISSVHVWTTGDMSVGLPGQNAVVQAEGDFLIDLTNYDEADRAPALQAFREKIKDAFQSIWDETPNVAFDYEVKEVED